MDLWRISDYRSLSGEGGLLYSARWHTAGRSIVYLAGSPAGALIEVLVHLELDRERKPPGYTLLRIHVPDDLEVPALAEAGAGTWKSNLRASRRLGDKWLAEGKSALAQVPSAILPHTWNYLLNPLHPEAAKVTIVSTVKAQYDLRLLGQ